MAFCTNIGEYVHSGYACSGHWYNIFYYTVLCLSLPTLTNGMIFYSDPTLGEGSVAFHSCDTGYTLNGGSTRTCQSDGTWSGSALACEGLRILISL